MTDRAAPVADCVSPGVRERLATIRADSPSWAERLSLVGAAIEEIARDRFLVRVIRRTALRDDRPALDGCSLSVSAWGAEDAVETMLVVAGERGGAAFASLAKAAARASHDAETLLQAAVTEDDGALALIATRCGVEPRAFASLAHLCATPLLFSARGALAPIRGDNGHSSPSRACPVCAADATLSESRGLAREHRLRCGRCGADWAAPELSCAFCGCDDASRLRSFVPDGEPSGRRAKACLSCRGYLKVLPTLEPLPAEQAMLEDLASADLDLAAAALGYARPDGSPRRVDVRILLDSSR